MRIEDDDAPISTYSPKKSIKHLFDNNLRLSQTLRFPFSPSANLIDLYALLKTKTKKLRKIVILYRKREREREEKDSLT